MEKIKIIKGERLILVMGLCLFFSLSLIGFINAGWSPSAPICGDGQISKPNIDGVNEQCDLGGSISWDDFFNAGCGKPETANSCQCLGYVKSDSLPNCVCVNGADRVSDTNSCDCLHDNHRSYSSGSNTCICDSLSNASYGTNFCSCVDHAADDTNGDCKCDASGHWVANAGNTACECDSAFGYHDDNGICCPADWSNLDGICCPSDQENVYGQCVPKCSIHQIRDPVTEQCSCDTANNYISGGGGNCIFNCSAWGTNFYCNGKVCCSKMECEVYHDDDSQTNWVRGFGPLKESNDYWITWSGRVSQLGCSYFHEVDPEMSLKDYGPIEGKDTKRLPIEQLNIDGLIKVTKDLEGLYGNPTGPDMLSRIFFIEYYGPGSGIDLNLWATMLTDLEGYFPFYTSMESLLPHYFSYAFISRSIVEYWTPNLNSQIELDAHNTEAVSFLALYNIPCSLYPANPIYPYPHYFCTIPNLGGYAGMPQGSLIKVVYVPQGDYVFSLTHLSQLFMSEHQLLNFFADFFKNRFEFLNPQNRNGDLLGLKAQIYFKTHPTDKLSDFLEFLKSPNTIPLNPDDKSDFCNLEINTMDCP